MSWYAVISKKRIRRGKTNGIGLIEGEVKKFNRMKEKFKIPHVGFNEVLFPKKSILYKDLDKTKNNFYFVHSYKLSTSSNSKNLNFAYCNHGKKFIASFEHKIFLELSFILKKVKKWVTDIEKFYKKLMPKKELYLHFYMPKEYFLISRNFQIQKIGNIDWLKKNYNFKEIANAIDELVVLNIGKKDNLSFDIFCNTLKEITKGIFVPVSAGGGINSIDKAKKILRSGADKIIINSLPLSKDKKIKEFVKVFGSQCVVISIDLIRKSKNNYKMWENNKKKQINIKIKDYLKYLLSYKIGEIYLTSIDKDGTGQGYDFDMLKFFQNLPVPIIISGGAGNWKHLYEGLQHQNIDAVSTANLLNFVDKGLLISEKIF